MHRDEQPEAPFVLKRGKEIFLKARPDVGERFIHPHAHDVLPVQAERAGAAGAPALREPRVFKDLVFDGGVSAEAKIGCAFKQQARAVCQAQRRKIRFE